MPAGGNNKRKRPDRQPSEDDGRRQSPYRPEKARIPAPPVPSPVARPPSRIEHPKLHTGQNAASGSPTPASLLEPPSTDALAQNVARPVLKGRRIRYQYLTDPIISSWANDGRQTVLTTMAGLDELQISNLFGELIRSGIDGRVPARDAGLTIRDIIVTRRQMDGMDGEFLFLNLISLLEEADHTAELRSLVAAAGIDRHAMHQELDIPILVSLNLVRSTFEKVRTRKTTNAIYRQANFNLLREESEGYAKLITDFFNTAQDASAHYEDDDLTAENASQRVKALVGGFDMDVGRVLDITLDVSATLLVKAYHFFTKFYRASPWWPDNAFDGIEWDDDGYPSLPDWALPGSAKSSLRTHEDPASRLALKQERDSRFWERVNKTGIDAFFALGARRITNFDSIAPSLDAAQPELDSRGKEADPNKRQRINEDRKFMRETRTLPPPGNYDAAQLLGFKLSFYASSARDSNDKLPTNLIHLAALLIKIGFISLRDLYPHLHPSDEQMGQEKARLEKEKAAREAKDRPGAASNALAIAGALTDDTVPAARTRVEKERSSTGTPAQEKKEDAKPLPTPDNQKIALLNALLLVGALPESLHILGRFPWIVDVDTGVTESLLRIAKHMLSQVTDLVKPLSHRPGLQDPKEHLTDTTSQPDKSLVLHAPLVSKKPPLRWLNGDTFNKSDGVQYQYYYADWSDNIPLCQTTDDVLSLCNTLLGHLGPKVGRDSVLYGTLLRLAKQSLTDDNSASNRSRWLELSRRLLVPALSLSKQNPDLADELSGFLMFYPTSTRYMIYAEWFTGRTSRLPDVKAAFDLNKAQVRDVLRRVSNDNEKRQARALAKVSFSSPGVVVIEMINQLESYSNMIPSLVECTRSFSRLAHDVLTWALINSLSGQGRDRIQPDGMLTSSWLQALSQFVATLYAKYNKLNPSPILQYLAFELQAGNSTDLELFEQMLVEMGGVRSDVELNDTQVLAMAGGEHLQTHFLQQLSDTRQIKKHKEGKRLIRALAEPHLIGPSLIAIAQERQMYPHHESSKLMPLKVLGNNLDKISAVFAQYLEVLKTNLTPDLFESAVPEATSLIGDFGLKPGVALTVCRTAIRYRMNEFDAAKKLEAAEKKDLARRSNSNTSVSLAEPRQTSLALPPADRLNESYDNMDEDDEGRQTLPDRSQHPGPWHPILEPIINELSAICPDLTDRLSIPFYVTFWTLGLPDVVLPHEIYTREKARIRKQVEDLANDRSDLGTAEVRERERKRKALLDMSQKLGDEPREQLNVCSAIRNRLGGSKNPSCEKLFWFSKPADDAANDITHLCLLQDCFLARAVSSPVDAHYSYRMAKLLHEIGTPNYSLMRLLHQLFPKTQLAAFICQCTALEAQNFGRFLCEVLKLMQRWHEKQELFDEEAHGQKPGEEPTGKVTGFVKKFDENGKRVEVMDWEGFRHLVYESHSNLNNALVSCFGSAEYMHIRNGIIVLKAVHQVFPVVSWMGQKMADQVTSLSKEDPRQDLKLAAMSLLGPLKNREKDWVLPQKFRLTATVKDRVKAPSTHVGSAQSRTGTPTPTASASDAKASTVEAVNGGNRKESVAGGKEDGEIDDEKALINNNGDTVMQDVPPPVAIESAKATQAELEKDRMVETPEPSRATVSKPGPQPNGAPRAEAIRTAAAPQPLSRGSSHNPPPRLPPAPARSNRFPPRDEGYGRLDRPGDTRPASRDQSPAHRARPRTPPLAARGPYRDDRAAERQPPAVTGDVRNEPHEAPSTFRRDQPRQQNRPPPDAREQMNSAVRGAEAHTHPERLKHIGPVPSVASASGGQQQAARQPPVIGAAPTTTTQSQGGQHSVNPDRLARIAADTPTVASSLQRGRESAVLEKDPWRDARPDDRSSYAPRGDSRPVARYPHENSREPGSRLALQDDLAPYGTRRGRPSDQEAPQHESSYGRLNGSRDVTPARGPMSGPNTRSNRNFTAPQPFPSGRLNEPTAPSPSASRILDSPASARGPARPPTTPQTDKPPVSGPLPSVPNAESGPPIHPSRAAQLNQVSLVQTNVGAPNGPRVAASPTTTAPLGPRGGSRGTSAAVLPQPANGPPPTAPASVAERQRKNERQWANINATLQGANPTGPPGQGMSFRGASNRQSSGTFGASTAPRPPAPTNAASEPPQRRSLIDTRQAHEDSPGNQAIGRGESFYGKPDRPHGTREAGREARNDAQDPPIRPQPPFVDDSRDRRGAPRDDRRPQDDRQLRDMGMRDRRGAGPEPPNRPDGAPRRGPGDVPNAFGGPGDWDRGPDMRSARRDDPPEDSRRGGRGGGGMGRTEDFRTAPLRREEEWRGPMTRDDAGGSATQGRHKRPYPEDGFEPIQRKRNGR